MSFHDQTTPFSIDEESDFFPSRSKRPSKNEQIYGLFYDGAEDSDSEQPHFKLSKPQTFTQESSSSRNYPNFKKSERLLYEPTTKIQVKYLQKAGQNQEENLDSQQNGNSEDEDGPKEEKSEIRARRVFDFKKKRKFGDLSMYGLPEALGSKALRKAQDANPGLSGLQTGSEAAKLRENYGKGFLMIKNLGFELGKGLGKEKQGILNPVEAVRKTAYNSNFENQTLERLERVDRKSEDIEDERPSRVLKDETENLSKRWKIGSGARKKRKVERKDLEDEFYGVSKGKEPVFEGKIIDMRGESAVFIENLAKNERKEGVLAEFRLILKADYEAKKHKLHEFLRKQRYEGDRIVNSRFEIEEIRAEIVKLGKNEDFFTESRGFIEVCAGKEKGIEETLEVFKGIAERFPEETRNFELFLYLLRSLCEKSKFLYANLAFDLYISKLLGVFTDVRETLAKLLIKDLKYTLERPDFLDKNPKTSEILEKALIFFFENSVLQRLRSHVLSTFDFFLDSDHFVESLDHWKLILPLKFIRKVFSEVIYPKMETEIREFEPFKCKVPINVWLVHWLADYREIIGKDGLFQVVENKLIRAMNGVDLLDERSKGFIGLLRPWEVILGKESWDNIVKRAIMPKLLYILQGLKIQPNDQDIKGFLLAREWMVFLEREQRESLLEKHVIEKLKEILLKWLGMKAMRVEEVSMWMEGWRGLLGKGSKIEDRLTEMERIIQERR